MPLRQSVLGVCLVSCSLILVTISRLFPLCCKEVVCEIGLTPILLSG